MSVDTMVAEADSSFNRRRVREPTKIYRPPPARSVRKMNEEPGETFYEEQHFHQQQCLNALKQYQNSLERSSCGHEISEDSTSHYTQNNIMDADLRQRSRRPDQQFYVPRRRRYPEESTPCSTPTPFDEPPPRAPSPANSICSVVSEFSGRNRYNRNGRQHRFSDDDRVHGKPPMSFSRESENVEKERNKPSLFASETLQLIERCINHDSNKSLHSSPENSEANKYRERGNQKGYHSTWDTHPVHSKENLMHPLESNPRSRKGKRNRKRGSKSRDHSLEKGNYSRRNSISNENLARTFYNSNSGSNERHSYDRTSSKNSSRASSRNPSVERMPFENQHGYEWRVRGYSTPTSPVKHSPTPLDQTSRRHSLGKPPIGRTVYNVHADPVYVHPQRSYRHSTEILPNRDSNSKSATKENFRQESEHFLSENEHKISYTLKEEDILTSSNEPSVELNCKEYSADIMEKLIVNSSPTIIKLVDKNDTSISDSNFSALSKCDTDYISSSGNTNNEESCSHTSIETEKIGDIAIHSHHLDPNLTLENLSINESETTELSNTISSEDTSCIDTNLSNIHEASQNDSSEIHKINQNDSSNIHEASQNDSSDINEAIKDNSNKLNESTLTEAIVEEPEVESETKENVNLPSASTPVQKKEFNPRVFSFNWADEVSQEDGDSWDALYDDSGNYLHGSVKQEIEDTIGKIKLEKPVCDYYEFQPQARESHELDEELGNIIEIYDFPASFQTQDLLIIFQEFKGFDLRWVDDTHALGIFSTSLLAAESLGLIHPFVKTRPLSKGIEASRLKGLKVAERLPFKPRPETSVALARRLVSGALGLKVEVSKEQRDAERQKLKKAKEKKRLIAKQKEDAWEGTFCS